MTPRTKMQKAVAELSEKVLPEINERQTAYAYRHCLSVPGFQSAKGKLTCGDCGQVFTPSEGSGETVCPHCGAKIEERIERKRSDKQIMYFGMVTTCKGYQVFRLFWVKAEYRKGKSVKRDVFEVVQRWMNDQGDTVVIARDRQMSIYYDMWNLYKPMSVKQGGVYGCIAYNTWKGVTIYPRKRIIPKLKRNGYNGNDCGTDARKLCFMLLRNPMFETIYKAGYYSLVSYLCNGYAKADDYWDAIKIAIRNRYEITDVSLWCDYINAMKALGKDIHNAAYVCPANLQEAHDNAINKRRTDYERRAAAKRRKEAAEAEADFLKLKGKFIGLMFSDELIQIHALNSVAEYLEEGERMHHCVYRMGYYKKPDALILSATINGSRVETIEVNLKTLEVVQSRAVCNGISPYHDRIINLVKRNRNLISSRMSGAVA